MSDDIVKHLQDTAWCKHYSDSGNNPSGKLMEEAADEITRLRTENEKLREVLAAERERCANIAEQARNDTCDGPVAWSMADSIAAAIRESGDE